MMDDGHCILLDFSLSFLFACVSQYLFKIEVTALFYYIAAPFVFGEEKKPY